MITEDNIDWLALNTLPLTPIEKQHLLERWSSPRAALEGMPELQRSKAKDDALREVERAAAKEITIIARTDPDYPPLLARCLDAPLVLYVRGQLDLQSPISIVGSRTADPYGLEAAEGFAKMLAESEIEIVSGLAYGIDAAAHRGALRGKGRTIAVLGSGLLKVYPDSHKNLADEIVGAGGAIISDFPLEQGPKPENFPMRNRIIAGISLGTLIVQAARRSGSLITARLASEYGRLVWVVPNRLGEKNSEGAFDLLRDGASIASSAGDILEDISPIRTR